MTGPASSLEAFRRKVVRLAELLGWKVFSHRPSRRTCGFPRLVLYRGFEGDKVIVAELKTGNSAPNEQQYGWLEALAKSGCLVFVWRSGDWDEIDRVLRKGQR